MLPTSEISILDKVNTINTHTHTNRAQTQGIREPPVAGPLCFSMVLCGRMLPTPTDTSSPHAFITTARGVYLMPPAPPLLYCPILLALNHQPVNNLDHITALDDTCIYSVLSSTVNRVKFIIEICTFVHVKGTHVWRIACLVISVVAIQISLC